ncbi:MAG: hypothetical protein ACHQXA_02435 [Gemmatimonadales bacterium]
MPDFSATWTQLLADLERERDELRLKVALGKAEAKSQLEKAEAKLDEFRHRAHLTKDTAQNAAGNVESAAKTLAAEIREAFARVRKTL